VHDDVHVQLPSRASSELAVGDPVRPAIGRAMLGSMLAAVVFFAVTWATKELPGLYVHEPWRDDPYDTFVSFAIFFVPSLVGLCLVRLPLCRRDSPLPLRRAIDLLRAGRALVAIMLVTLLSEWASVVIHAHDSAWSAATTVLICVLAVLTALTVVAAWELRGAGRGLRPLTNVPPQPDWLADALALGEREAAWLGSRRDHALRALSWLDRQLVRRTQRHPLRAAAALALLFGVAVASTQATVEGYGPSAALLFVVVAACGMFAFLVGAGAHLRLVGTYSDSPRRAVRALTLGCASVPLTLAFRSSLWWIVGTNDRDAGPTQLAMLILGIAVAIGGLVIAGELLVRSHK
jgi:hypothetical protein